MPKEIETKFKITSPREIRTLLKKIKARFTIKQLEKDIYYKVPGALSRINSIRLRKISKKDGLFTIKSLTKDNPGGIFKVLDEKEMPISEVERFKNILKALGFEIAFRKEKRREIYSYSSTKITLDKLPFIGWYLEIEGSKNNIKKLAKLLCLDMNSAIPGTYMSIFNEYRKHHKRKDLELTFENERHNLP
ncbi:MAG: class IV adenylate cyclase [Candidatus Omnitrophota bacterium]